MLLTFVSSMQQPGMRGFAAAYEGMNVDLMLDIL